MTPPTWPFDAGLPAALEALAAGRLILFPTETVYGVGARCDRPAAVAALRAAKGRAEDKPLQVLVPCAAAAAGLARFNRLAAALAARFWPGPLTLVLPAESAAPAELVTAAGTIGLRCPQHAGLARLLAGSGPLAASSANLAGQPPATTCAAATAALGSAVALALDGGPASLGQASTVVAIEGDGWRMLRPGALTAAQLAEAVDG
jgi:L-threonylcarbamoyladenylate synthase